MAGVPIRILLVEDSPADARLLTEALADAGEQFDVSQVERMEDALIHLRSRDFDAILLDLFLPDSSGLTTLEQANAAAPHLPIVVLTGLDDESTGVEAVRKGAQDFLTKGHASGQLLARAVRYAVERKRAEEEIRVLNTELERRVIERTAVAEQRANQLRALASELILTEERERRHLAQILHDHLQQLLYAARLGIGSMRSRVRGQDLRDSLQHVDDLLRESLEASRSLTVELSPPILHDAGLAASLTWLGQHMKETYNLSVAAELDAEAEVPAEDLRILLFQAVRELLFNVVKHARVLRASVKTTRSDDRHIRIVVSDDGAGFDPARTQAEGAEAATFGLFGVRERLRQIGGSVDVDSAPGKGTRVVIVAPCARPCRPALEREARPVPEPPSAETPPDACRQPRDARTIRVLLADDHKVLREGLARLLREQPDLDLVGEAEDGRRAVELALHTQPDVVVMDVTMPVLNGIEATRRIVAALPGVRVIGLSMHEEEDMARAMLEAGATGYLRKGGPSGPLIAAIRRGADCRDGEDGQP
jgi:DNA-binding NarL/FixJ family response regulator/anti-sigma regulatory factor (Ser/Thr protein kinase)